MDAFFLKLLNMSIAASWLILAVLVLRLVLKKTPKWLTCILWGIVAVRLILPFSFESMFSLVPSAEVLPRDVITGNTFRVETGFSVIDYSVNDYLGDHYYEGITVSAGRGSNVMTVLGSIWLVGMLILLAYSIFSYVKLLNKLREAALLQDRVWLCDAVKSPFILGMVNPRIYLPSAISESQMEYVLAHEHAHLKRRDHWWKPLGYLLLAVYWFNPLVWVAYILLCRDIEIACDEKVIKDMDLEGKKTYSKVLVSCSMQRRMIMACPLAFGEVGVKERVKKVLNYRKPAFWIIIGAVITCIVVAVCFLTNPANDTFTIKIMIPAGGEDPFYYSDEEISPVRSKIMLSSGEGLGDTEVVLIPGKITGGTGETHGPTYMTPGMPVKMDVEKGEWFRVGVAMSNPTDRDIVVYVRIKGVNVAIADYAVDGGAVDPGLPDLHGSEDDENESGIVAGTDEAAYSEGTISFHGIIVKNTMDATVPIILVKPMGDEIPYEYVAFVLPEEEADWVMQINSLVAITCIDCFVESQPPFGELISIGRVGSAPDNQGAESPGTAITAAIMERYAFLYPEKYDFACCDFIVLGELSATPVVGETTHIITYYGWALYQKYNISEQGIEDLGGAHLPLALTFKLDEEGYHLTEFWEPDSGSYFASSVRDKFPIDIFEDGIDSQKYVIQQKQNCYKQAVLFSGVDAKAVIENLLDTICSGPGESSNPYDYIAAHEIEYRELLYYGEYTLRYCFKRFDDGKGTGLDGHIMASACKEILQTQGQLPLDVDTAATGQQWYDALLAHAGNIVDQYLERSITAQE